MVEFSTIQIDFDVHKKIEVERRGFDETHNEALRRLLGLPSEAVRHPARKDTDNATPIGRLWSGHGVQLPHGTALRMEHNSRIHEGEIVDGVWLVEGKRYVTPSGAAGGVAITRAGHKTKLDGWKYWQAKRPHDAGWTYMAELRRQARQKNIV